MQASSWALPSPWPARRVGLFGAAVPWFCAVVALLLLFTGRSNFEALPRPAIIWMTFGFTVLIAVHGYVTARASGMIPWIAPVFVVALFFAVRYGLAAVFIDNWHEYPWQVFTNMRRTFFRFGSWQYLPSGCYLILLFGAGMNIGLTLAAAAGSGGPRSAWRFDESRLKRGVMLYAPVALFIHAFAHFDLPLTIKFAVSLLGEVINPVIAICSYWLFSSRSRQERLIWGAFVVLLCLVSMRVGLHTGQLVGSLLPWMLAGFGYVLARGAPPWKLLLPAVPVLFLLVLPYLSIYKQAGKRAIDTETRIRESLVRYERVGTAGRMELTLERTAARFAGAYMPAVYARYYPDAFPYEYGKSFLFELSSLIPRPLWPDKPYLSWELNHYPVRLGLASKDFITTILFDAISEYYLNFGPTGVFVLAILHGLYLQLLYNWLVLYVNPVIGSALVITMFLTNEDFYGIGLMMTAQSKEIPVWLALLYLLSRVPLGRKRHAVQPTA